MKQGNLDSAEELLSKAENVLTGMSNNRDPQMKGLKASKMMGKLLAITYNNLAQMNKQ